MKYCIVIFLTLFSLHADTTFKKYLTSEQSQLIVDYYDNKIKKISIVIEDEFAGKGPTTINCELLELYHIKKTLLENRGEYFLRSFVSFDDLKNKEIELLYIQDLKNIKK